MLPAEDNVEQQGTLPAQFPAGVKGEYFGFKRYTTDQYGHGIVYRPVSVGKSYERIPLRVSGEISKYVPDPGGKVDGGLEVQMRSEEKFYSTLPEANTTPGSVLVEIR